MGEQACNPAMFLWASILLLLSVPRISSVTIHTAPELSFGNGTLATLPCTFQSSSPVSPQTAVTWQYVPSGGSPTVLLYYSGGESYHGNIPQFKDRVNWAGNLDKGDASISIADMHFADNGTFRCSVVNPPDVASSPRDIQVHVVEQGSSPRTSREVWVIVPALLGVVVLIIAIIVFVIYRKKKKDKMNYHGAQ
ncbi:myelin protein zero-like protein 1 isoform X2 [Protopterus annectens]|uniref:myelin protein zero-like protein 1 isoform X2 n=1 Tax=Protopterus annectens TaxID=7888 RepID=UPI001CFA175D|nr:myelin protein zero-like protein 1 isoform X2 [Protopterus annectens]